MLALESSSSVLALLLEADGLADAGTVADASGYALPSGLISNSSDFANSLFWSVGSAKTRT